MTTQPNNPLHGITLKRQVEELVAHYGWEALGQKIKIKCFIDKPSVNSSLTFLRKTPWAREKVESLYLYVQRKQADGYYAGFYRRTGRFGSELLGQSPMEFLGEPYVDRAPARRRR